MMQIFVCLLLQRSTALPGGAEAAAAASHHQDQHLHRHLHALLRSLCHHKVSHNPFGRDPRLFPRRERTHVKKSCVSRLQDRGVVPGGAHQPPLGGAVQVLGVQQGGLRPLRLLAPAPPVPQDLRRHRRPAAQTLPRLRRVATGLGGPRRRLTRGAVTPPPAVASGGRGPAAVDGGPPWMKFTRASWSPG